MTMICQVLNDHDTTIHLNSYLWGDKEKASLLCLETILSSEEKNAAQSYTDNWMRTDTSKYFVNSMTQTLVITFMLD